MPDRKSPTLINSSVVCEVCFPVKVQDGRGVGDYSTRESTYTKITIELFHHEMSQTIQHGERCTLVVFHVVRQR